MNPRDRLHRLLETNRAIQFVYLAIQGFVSNRCPVRAAALAYTTLLAMIPLLVVVFWVFQGPLKESSTHFAPVVLNKLVVSIAPELEYLPATGESATLTGGQVTISARGRQEAVEQIQSFLGNIETGKLGTVGTLLLIVIAIRLLMTIEASFNDIWGVTRGRSIWRKVVYYWAVITLAPLLLFGAIAVTGTVEFAQLSGKLLVAPWIERFLLKLLPFVLLWAGFTLLYALMPNTRVRWTAALAGGVIGGSLWQINNLLNTMYVSRVVTYSKIYGSLGIIPVLLAGLYVSWLIVLFGAQVSYAAQNVRAHFQQRAGERFDQLAHERFACRLVLTACRNFLNGQSPPTAETLAGELSAPPQLLNRLVTRLIQGDVLAATADEPSGLLPARPPEQITLADVLHVVRTRAGNAPVASNEPVANLLAELQGAERAAPANLSFRDLAARG
jgi:membrane protein